MPCLLTSARGPLNDGANSPAVASAAVLAIAFSVMHALHVSLGARVQNVLAVAKIALIAVFIVGGLAKVDLGLLFVEPLLALFQCGREALVAQVFHWANVFRSRFWSRCRRNRLFRCPCARRQHNRQIGRAHV